MTYLQVSVEFDKRELNQLEKIFVSLNSVSNTISPIYTVSEDSLRVNPTWNRAKFQSLLPLETDVHRLRAALNNLRVKVVELKFVGEQDWVKQWRQSLEPLNFGAISVVPKDYSSEGIDHPVVRLDPGLAFGSGTHESTALCLRWLARQDLRGKSVLDAGCGSGILSIAAAKLGAGPVTAVDIDDKARFVTQENAEFNQINLTVRDSLDLNSKFDIIVSNILCSTLIELARSFRRMQEENGLIALAGILDSQIAEVQLAYPFIDFESTERSGSWVLLSGVRNR